MLDNYYVYAQFSALREVLSAEIFRARVHVMCRLL